MSPYAGILRHELRVIPLHLSLPLSKFRERDKPLLPIPN